MLAKGAQKKTVKELDELYERFSKAMLKVAKEIIQGKARNAKLRGLVKASKESAEDRCDEVRKLIEQNSQLSQGLNTQKALVEEAEVSGLCAKEETESAMKILSETEKAKEDLEAQLLNLTRANTTLSEQIQTLKAKQVDL